MKKLAFLLAFVILMISCEEITADQERVNRIKEEKTTYKLYLEKGEEFIDFKPETTSSRRVWILTKKQDGVISLTAVEGYNNNDLYKKIEIIPYKE